VHFLLCDEDLAKGGRFWINMFARKIPMMVILVTLSSFSRCSYSSQSSECIFLPNSSFFAIATVNLNCVNAQSFTQGVSITQEKRGEQILP